MLPLQKITPNLWFDRQAEEAAMFYISVFRDSRIGRISRYGPEGYEIHGMPEGTVMTEEFQLEGQKFMALNGGPHLKCNEAISFIVSCNTQEEVDYYWDRLREGGDEKAQVCGWLKDRYGVSWQIVPAVLNEMLKDQSDEKAQRAMRSMLRMTKLEIAALTKAYEGK